MTADGTVIEIGGDPTSLMARFADSGSITLPGDKTAIKTVRIDCLGFRVTGFLHDLAGGRTRLDLRRDATLDKQADTGAAPDAPGAAQAGYNPADAPLGDAA